MMKILFLDLASHSTVPHEGACIACVSDKKTEAIRFIDHRIGDTGILPVLDEVLKEAKWKDSDLTHIACVVGPGGFTSLRMAVTLANVYGDQLKIPVAGVHLSSVYEFQVGRFQVMQPNLKPANLPTCNFVWLHATKKQALFARGFGDYASLWNEPTLVTLDDLVEKIPEGAVVGGEILPDQKAALASKNLKDAQLAPLADVLPSLLSALDYKHQVLEPWYGRGW